MAYLIERKAQVLYITASSITKQGKRRKIVIESRPEYVVISLQGLKEEFSVSWELLFETARRHHAENLRIEAKADTQRQATQRRPS